MIYLNYVLPTVTYGFG